MAKHAAWSRWLAWGLALAAACSQTKTQPVGELVLFIDTDMEVPKDLTAVRVQLSTPTGGVRYDMRHELGPNGFRLPATLGILAGVEDQPVTIRVTAFHEQDAITLREMVTTVPRDRQVILPVHIQWLCYGTATVTAAGISSTCPAGQSCVAGGCQNNLVDSATLPTFDSTSVYGGGTSPATGTCFDAVGCFASGYAARVEAPCSIEAPRLGSTDQGVNVALVRPLGTEGICGKEACLVPLNAESDSGWKTSGGRIALPPAVCDRLLDGSVAGVAVTTACAEKSETEPTCGLWSTVTAVQATTDAGAPSGIAVASSAGGGGQGGVGGAAGSGGAAALVAHYTFDESEAAAPAYLDSSGNGRDLTRGAAAAADSSDPQISTQHVNGQGHAAQFDGVDDYAWRAADAAFTSHGFTLSASMWLASATLGAGELHPLLSTLTPRCQGGGYQLAVRGSATGTPEVVFAYRGTDTCSSHELVFDLALLPGYDRRVPRPDTIWYEVTATYEELTPQEQRARLYLFGKLLKETTFNDPINYTGVSRFIVGANQDAASGLAGAAWYSGHLDEVSVFGRALATTEVADLFTATSCLPGPSGYPWCVLDFAQSQASWVGTPSQDSATIHVVDGASSSSGLLALLAAPGSVVDLSAYDELVLDADVPSGAPFEVHLIRGEAAFQCSWSLTGRGSASYVIDLGAPQLCQLLTCPFDFRVEQLYVGSAWTAASDLDLTVRGFRFQTTGSGVGSRGPVGGAAGPGGWCWQPGVTGSGATAQWSGTPSAAAVSATLNGPANTSAYLQASVAGVQAATATNVELDATIPSGTSFSLQLRDPNWASCEWVSTGQDTATYRFVLNQYSSCYDGGGQLPQFNLANLDTVAVGKAYGTAVTNMTITVTGLRFIGASGSGGTGGTATGGTGGARTGGSGGAATL